MNRYAKWGIAVAAVILAPILFGACVLAFTVDDWSRDLSTNEAATSQSAADADLRPLETALSPAALADVLEAAAKNMNHWEQASRKSTSEKVTIQFVRTTGFMQYEDDITATIEPTKTGSVLTVFSKSRVGKGDLGQNPRNIKELISATRNLINVQ